ncbi:MAG: type II toxin-antitoxin system VapC family toxin [Thermoanaerobaculales bacterium]|nr:type II toxin-antitoxin system VapC family toxin [Thermoanaerobaculales bacterium]
MPFVLDCSVTMSWVFSDERTPDTTELLQSLTEDVAVVPQIWSFEVANVLLVATRRGRIKHNDQLHLVAAITALPIEVDRESHSQALTATLNIASEQGLSAYDAAYLELALRRSLPLATLDRRLRSTCAAVGVVSVLG